MNNYKGASAASEPETKAIQEEIKRLGSSLKMVLNLQDYESYIRIPWAKGQTVTDMDEKTTARVSTDRKIMLNRVC